MKKLFILLLIMPCWCMAQYVPCKCPILKIGLPSEKLDSNGSVLFPRFWEFDCKPCPFSNKIKGFSIAGWSLEELDSIYYAQPKKLRLENGGGVPGPIGIDFDYGSVVTDSGRITFEGSGGSLAGKIRLDGNGNINPTTGVWEFEDDLYVLTDTIEIIEPLYDTVPQKLRPTEAEPAKPRTIEITEGVYQSLSNKMWLHQAIIDSLKTELFKCQEKSKKDQIIIESLFETIKKNNTILGSTKKIVDDYIYTKEDEFLHKNIFKLKCPL